MNRAPASVAGKNAPDLGDELLVVDRLAQDGANRFVLDSGDVVGRDVDDLEPRATHPRQRDAVDVRSGMTMSVISRSIGRVFSRSSRASRSSGASKTSKPAARNTLTDARPDATPGGNETLPIVDDNEDVREAAVIVGSLGYEVLTASDAAEALLLIRSHCGTDLLVSDM